MKLTDSSYLTAVKPCLQKLLEQLLKTYSYASILATDAESKNYRVAGSGVDISQSRLFSGRGFVAKVYDGHSYAEYSFSRISEALIEDIQNKIKEQLIPLEGKLPEGISVNSYGEFEDTEKLLHESSEYEQLAEDIGDEKTVSFLTELRKDAMKQDERIIDAITVLSYRQYSNLYLSKNKDMTQNLLWTTGSVILLAPRGEEIKQYYKGYSKLGGLELIDEMRNDLSVITEALQALLISEPMIPREYECICTPEVTGMIVHEAFGHGVEMDMFVKKRALAEQYIGKYVASPLVTMHDGGSAAEQTATFFFDDEGTVAQDTVIIDKGILVRGISDCQTAAALGTCPTGNGRRQNYDRKAYTRMTNTFFEGGNDRYEDMIASVQNGFLLEDATSGMEDPKNWGIQCMVNMAREIKDGKLTGKVYSPVVLTGYVPDLLKSISMMSEKVELGGGGYCGKGYKEWVKVSDGGPYIKARIRLG